MAEQKENTYYIFLNQGTATGSVRKRVGKKLRGAYFAKTY